MLRQVSSSDSRFKSIEFRSGLNILVSDRTGHSKETDSRNGVGKSSLVELLHFLLGGNVSKNSFFMNSKLKNSEFQLKLDWPNTSMDMTVTRKPACSNKIKINPLPSGFEVDSDQLDFRLGEVDNSKWQSFIEKDLFNLPDEHPGISGRVLLSFLMRRASSHAFNNPTETHAKQRSIEGAVNLAYLLGLDWGLVDRYRNLQASTRKSKYLKEAANDPILGNILGKASELRGQIAVCEDRVRQLKNQISEFRVVPEYENLQHRADDMDRRIRSMRNEDIIDKKNLESLRKAVAEEINPDVSYIPRVYFELGIVLGDQVQHTYSEVEVFHASVVRNRQRYLSEEMAQIQSRLQEREAERQRLGEELASILASLKEGGALDALTVLQQVLAQEQSMLSAFKHRFEASQRMEAHRRDINRERLALQQELESDIDDRRHSVDEAAVLFAQFAHRLYGNDRDAYLRFEAGKDNLRIDPHIARDNSVGINNMVIFCFDLTIAVLGCRNRRAPNFLIHDSHLFDGVDERQVARALRLGADITASENMQYIVAMNSDELDKTVRQGFDASPYILEQRLTDAYEEGGLFGFRGGPSAMLLARKILSHMRIFPLQTKKFEYAGIVEPRIMRSLDALHIAAALSLGDDLAGIISYDLRMIEAARFLGIDVASPGA